MLTLALLPYKAFSAYQHWFIEVPNGMMDIDGNDGSRLPFLTQNSESAYYGPVHFQQVYAASQFSQIPTNGAYLTHITFRQNCASGGSRRVFNLAVRLSTTSKTPDHLSAIFAENIGADESMVYGPTNYIPPGGVGPCPSVDTFLHGQYIGLTTPFYYEPKKGNLLMDIQHGGTSWDTFYTNYKLDAHSIDNDSISCIAAYSLQATNAEITSTMGLITAFSFYPTPALGIRRETNNIVLTWPINPEMTFQLQWTDRIGGFVPWLYYSGEIYSTSARQTVTIPKADYSSKIFRLYKTTQNAPQPLLILPDVLSKQTSPNLIP
jgi:hypothetical protein